MVLICRDLGPRPAIHDLLLVIHPPAVPVRAIADHLDQSIGRHRKECGGRGPHSTHRRRSKGGHRDAVIGRGCVDERIAEAYCCRLVRSHSAWIPDVGRDTLKWWRALAASGHSQRIHWITCALWMGTPAPERMIASDTACVAIRRRDGDPVAGVAYRHRDGTLRGTAVTQDTPAPAEDQPSGGQAARHSAGVGQINAGDLQPRGCGDRHTTRLHAAIPEYTGGICSPAPELTGDVDAATGFESAHECREPMIARH